jgi:hypothetical protein
LLKSITDKAKHRIGRVGAEFNFQNIVRVAEGVAPNRSERGEGKTKSESGCLD